MQVRARVGVLGGVPCLLQRAHPAAAPPSPPPAPRPGRAACVPPMARGLPPLCASSWQSGWTGRSTGEEWGGRGGGGAADALVTPPSDPSTPHPHTHTRSLPSSLLLLSRAFTVTQPVGAPGGRRAIEPTDLRCVPRRGTRRLACLPAGLLACPTPLTARVPAPPPPPLSSPAARCCPPCLTRRWRMWSCLQLRGARAACGGVLRVWGGVGGWGWGVGGGGGARRGPHLTPPTPTPHLLRACVQPRHDRGLRAAPGAAGA